MKKQFPWYQILKHERVQRGWSQEELAAKIGGDIKTIQRWERGLSQPRPYYRQQLMALFGKNADAWGWTEQTHKEDWGEAPGPVQLYGRRTELATVRQWIETEKSRCVAILGLGGIGKTTFARAVSDQVKGTYEAVFWRSLQNAPLFTDLLKTCLLFFGPEHIDPPGSPEAQIELLITFFRERRCLLILDNVEALFQIETSAGLYRPGYEGYGRLFLRLGESEHQSCLLLTSREKPGEVAWLDGALSAVHALLLTGLEQIPCQQLLQQHHLAGSEELWTRFVELYGGNPLALKLIATSIKTLFGGNIARFLIEEEAIFGDLHILLDQQFRRLSRAEQEVMYWLAIEREAVSFQEISRMIHAPRSRRSLLEAFQTLSQRFFLETQPDGLFTLQPVIQEYVTGHLVEHVYQELLSGKIVLLNSHALLKAQGMDYIRQSQERFILAPLLKQLRDNLGQTGSIDHLRSLLAMLHQEYLQKPGYVSGNLLNLLVHLQATLQGADFSRLVVRQAYLQGVTLRQVNFTQADLATSVFTDTFSSILCVAVSPNGQILAAGTTTDEVRLWQATQLTPIFTCTGHSDGIRQVVFSPDSRLLASASEDETVRIWDTATGDCLHVLQGHRRMVRSISFRSDGRVLASGSEDHTVRLWDTRTGRCLHILQGHGSWVRAVSFSASSGLLASASDDLTLRIWESETGHCLHSWPILSQPRSLAFQPESGKLVCGHEDHAIRLWDSQTGHCLQVFSGHAGRVRAIAFTTDSQIMASASDDTTVRLWSMADGTCLRTLQGHSKRVWSVAFIPDSPVLISASDDDTLRYWQTTSGQALRTEQGYSSLIKSIAFSPDGQCIASGSEDQRLRLWNVASGHCLHVLNGHSGRIRAVAWSPVGNLIATASEDETVRLWDASSQRCLAILRGHTHLVRAVAFAPGGKILASGGFDQTVRLWNLTSGACLQVLQHQSLIWGIAFHREGKLLASGDDDQGLHLWNVDTGEHLHTLRGHTHKICAVAFSLAGSYLVSASDDLTLRIWESTTGDCLRVLQGHTQWVRCVAFSPDGRYIISGSHDRTVRLWDVQSGACLQVLSGHSSRISSVTFNPITNNPASSSDDGTIKCWDSATGACIQTFQSERPYEEMNITSASGLTTAQKISLKLLGAVAEEEK